MPTGRTGPRPPLNRGSPPPSQPSAVAVLAVVGRFPPIALRVFLLTLALLVGDLAYMNTEISEDYAKIGAPSATLPAGLMGASFLAWRIGKAKRAGSLPMSEQE